MQGLGISGTGDLDAFALLHNKLHPILEVAAVIVLAAQAAGILRRKTDLVASEVRGQKRSWGRLDAPRLPTATTYGLADFQGLQSQPGLNMLRGKYPLPRGELKSVTAK